MLLPVVWARDLVALAAGLVALVALAAGLVALEALAAGLVALVLA